MIIAVETADVVNSTKLNNTLFEKADSVLNDELQSHVKAFNTSFQRYRGDAFQVLYNKPQVAVTCALMNRLRLQFDVYEKPVLLTQSIAIGEQQPDNKMGDIFIASGRQLDVLKRAGFAVGFEDSSEQAPINMSLATLFLNDLLNHLTQKQAETLYWYIKTDFAEHHIIAKKLNSTRQNISIHLARAKAELVKAYITSYQSHFAGEQ